MHVTEDGATANRGCLGDGIRRTGEPELNENGGTTVQLVQAAGLEPTLHWEQMIELEREYLKEGEYHHPYKPGARYDAPDGSASAFVAASNVEVGQIIVL